jgi:aminopeptidase YwaD
MYRILCALLLVSFFASAQKITKADKAIAGYLQQQVSYLASDELKGRRAGDAGELAAANFIASKFTEIGLLPKGDNNAYFQLFSINDGKMIDPTTQMAVNGKKLNTGIDFIPLSNSPKGSAKAEISPSLNEKGLPWMIDLAESFEENKNNPHFDINNLITEKTKTVASKGAPSVIFYCSVPGEDKIKFDGKDRSENLPIPTLYVTQKGRDAFFPDLSSSYNVEFTASVTNKIRQARNVVGYIDNGAPLTLVIGAHFDHLGYGEDGNSMIRNGEPAIHNGADDNASGTSSMIELAFLLKKSKAKQYNYLFIAFSAEELGLNGSKYFVENPTISLNTVNYMINMDMVGRMNDSTKTITVGGYGTSPNWKTMIDGIKKKTFTIRYDSSGSGPSDHTSFYRKDIPVLFFFTGLHTDYHKPSDDADKINYLGMVQIIRFIQQLIENDKQPQRLVFTKTREQQTTTSARFSVSMGIMPDYSYPGNGVRVDGVTENRPAKKAGILAGDIVKQLGEHKTSSVEAYMQALSKFKKGDKTTAIVNRGDKELTFSIEF